MPYNAEYYAKNKEAYHARARKYWAKNRESILKRRKEKWVLNREKLIAASREYYQKHREKRLDAKRKQYLRERESILEKAKDYFKRNKKRIYAYRKNRYAFDRLGFKSKMLCRAELRKAILKGIVNKIPCEICGSIVNLHGHHEDYNKPLEVRWLCRKHHFECHRGSRSINGAAFS